MTVRRLSFFLLLFVLPGMAGAQLPVLWQALTDYVSGKPAQIGISAMVCHALAEAGSL